MNLKREARKLGREIRKHTGLPLPIAMRVAKHSVRGKIDGFHLEPLQSKGIPIALVECECCGPTHLNLDGPKGWAEFTLGGRLRKAAGPDGIKFY